MSADPMDWIQYAGARLLISEETVGRQRRAPMHAEDDGFAASKKQLEGR